MASLYVSFTTIKLGFAESQRQGDDPCLSIYSADDFFQEVTYM
jgi:hypothetical protein